MAKDAESGEQTAVRCRHCRQPIKKADNGEWELLGNATCWCNDAKRIHEPRITDVGDPYKSYLDYGLAHAALSIEASLGITPDTPVKVTIPLPGSSHV